MGAVADFLDDTPRIRLLEALIRLGPREFTRAELAREAGMWRMSVNRAFDKLADDRIVFKVGRAEPPKYKVNQTSARLQLLAYFTSALSAVVRRADDGEASARTLEGFLRAASGVRQQLSLTKTFADNGMLVSTTQLADRPARATSSAKTADVEIIQLQGFA